MRKDASLSGHQNIYSDQQEAVVIGKDGHYATSSSNIFSECFLARYLLDIFSAPELQNKIDRDYSVHLFLR